MHFLEQKENFKKLIRAYLRSAQLNKKLRGKCSKELFRNMQHQTDIIKEHNLYFCSLQI